MARLPAAAILVALVACQRQPARIYTDKEIAALEARVLAKVAEVDASCSKPELLEFVASLDAECERAMHGVKRGGLNPESKEFAAIDELCGANVVAAFGRAAVASPSCSPYQVGVRVEPFGPPGKSPELAPMWLAYILSSHALREVNAYVALTELFMGVRVYQDLVRGRISTMQLTMGNMMENRFIAASAKVLERSSVTNEQLDDLAAMLEAAIQSEPRIGDALQGDALQLALHHGLAGLKPRDWQPPGGRSELTANSKDAQARSQRHDWRDDSAQNMAAGLRNVELYAERCPASATLTACYANLMKDAAPWEFDPTARDRHSARIRVFPDDETRHDSQRQLLEENTTLFVVEDVQERAVLVSRLIALRMRVRVLREGRCPSETQLGEESWMAMSTAPVLGDSVRTSRTEDALVVDAPAWALKPINNPARYKPPFPPPIPRAHEPVSIPCP